RQLLTFWPASAGHFLFSEDPQCRLTALTGSNVGACLKAPKSTPLPTTHHPPAEGGSIGRPHPGICQRADRSSRFRRRCPADVWLPEVPDPNGRRITIGNVQVGRSACVEPASTLFLSNDTRTERRVDRERATGASSATRTARPGNHDEHTE